MTSLCTRQTLAGFCRTCKQPNIYFLQLFFNFTTLCTGNSNTYVLQKSKMFSSHFEIIDFSYTMRLLLELEKNLFFEFAKNILLRCYKKSNEHLGQVYLNFVMYTKAVPLIKNPKKVPRLFNHFWAVFFFTF